MHWHSGARSWASRVVRWRIATSARELARWRRPRRAHEHRARETVAATRIATWKTREPVPSCPSAVAGIQCLVWVLLLLARWKAPGRCRALLAAHATAVAAAAALAAGPGSPGWPPFLRLVQRAERRRCSGAGGVAGFGHSSALRPRARAHGSFLRARRTVART